MPRRAQAHSFLEEVPEVDRITEQSQVSTGSDVCLLTTKVLVGPQNNDEDTICPWKANYVSHHPAYS
jgi:hypothetical protein